MKRWLIIAMIAAMAIVHGLACLWSPVLGDDWGQRVWLATHDGSFFATHYLVSDLVTFAVVQCAWVNAVLGAVASCALVVGAFVLAMRRLPRAELADALGLALISTMLWIGGPHAGVVWFHRSYVASSVLGCAIAVWLLAPLACGWRVSRSLIPVIAIGGYAVATSTRTLAAAMLVGTLIALRGRARELWHRVLVGALLVGTAAAYATPPWLEVPKVVKRGLDPNLVLINVSLREAGHLVALVVFVVLVNAALAAFDKPSASRTTLPDLAHAWRWAVACVATAVWALFGPRASEATLLPVTVALAIAVLPLLMWAATGAYVRRGLVALAIGTHAVVWTMSLDIYHRLAGEYAARTAAIEAAAPGSVAVVPAYSQILPTFFEFGEDFAGVASRQLIANKVYGVRDIAVNPPFRKYEPDPDIRTRLDVDGATDAQVRAARPPALWAGDPTSARYEFTLFAKRLRDIAPAAHARLTVTNVAFDQPLVIAQLDAGTIFAPHITRSSGDANDRYTYTIRNPEMFDQAKVITNGVSVAVDYRGGHPGVQPLLAAPQVLVLCGKRGCVLGDAFVPRF